MEEKEQTNEEIIKELDEYIENGYSKTDGKIWLDHILRLQEENEQLKRDVHDMSWVIKIHKYCVGADHCQNSSAREFELQKQVDELKEENKELYKENTTLIAGSILERKDIAKDTAKEILQRGKYCMPSGLREWIEERYGLEVE